jgi:hypothetical protein
VLPAPPPSNNTISTTLTRPPTLENNQLHTNTPNSHNGWLPTPSRPPLAQTKVLAIPRRRAPLHLCAKLSQITIFFFTNPRALQHRHTKQFRLPRSFTTTVRISQRRNTAEFWLSRSFAETVDIVQDLQATALPDQSNATGGKHHTLAVLFSQRIFLLTAKSSASISISSSGSNRKYSIEIPILLLHTWPRVHGARRFETETETEA